MCFGTGVDAVGLEHRLRVRGIRHPLEQKGHERRFFRTCHLAKQRRKIVADINRRHGALCTQ